MATPQVLYRTPRKEFGSTLVLALVLAFGGLALTPYLGLAGTLTAISLLVSVFLYLWWLSGYRVIWYEPVAKHLVVEWRNLFFGLRRDVFPASRFASVISFYPWGKASKNFVYVLERSGEAGVSVASFDLNYQYRSFWDLFPKIIESVDARELRTQLVSNLGLADEGFVGLRRHPKASKGSREGLAT